MVKIKYLLFDWGDTLMIDYPQYKGEMITWEKVSPMPGVMETIPVLSTHYPCAVVSNATDSNAISMKQAFKRISLDTYFSLYITSKELGVSKPDPNFFTRIAKQLSTSEEQICMIGNDYDKDIVGAKKIGMKTVLIGQKCKDYPSADHIIESFHKLRELLL